MASESVEQPFLPFDAQTEIDRVRAIGDLLVSAHSLNDNTLPTIGGMLFEIADKLAIAVPGAKL